MKSLRLSGSTRRVTCSADTTVPWMTSRSGSARRMCSARPRVRCGVTATATVIPEALSSRIRASTSSGCTGAA